MPGNVVLVSECKHPCLLRRHCQSTAIMLHARGVRNLLPDAVASKRGCVSRRLATFSLSFFFFVSFRPALVHVHGWAGGCIFMIMSRTAESVAKYM